MTRTVTFYRRTSEETEQRIGTITMQDRRLVADPPDSVALQNVLADEIWVHRKSGQPLVLNAREHPMAFIENLQKEFGRGSYFWCIEATD